ncbi:MAG: diguanylate cyclase domain-containing protein [Clostridia bacterium]
MEEKDLAAERVATLYSVARPVYAGGVALALMLVVVLWEADPAALLLGWLAAMVLIMVGRGLLHLRFVRAREPRDPFLWERRFSLGALCSGLAWSFVPVLLAPNQHPLLEAAVVIIVGGLLMAGAGLSAASRRSVYLLVVPPLVALTVHLAMQPDSVHRLLALAVALFSLVVARMAQAIHGALVDSLRERLRNRALLERVERSETRLRDAINSVPDGIAIWDAEDRMVVCNESYARLYGGGLAPAQLVGTPFERAAAQAWETEHPAARGNDAVRGEFIAHRIARHREGSGETHQFQARDGRWRMARTVKMRAGGWVGLVTDITDLRSAQDAFLRVLAEEDLVLDTLPVGVAFIEKQKIVRCNRRLEELLGYGPGELNGQSTRIWFSSEERWSEARRESYQRMRGGGIMEGDARLVRRDGSRAWCRVVGRSLHPETPEGSSILTFTDIDTRLAAERALRESEEKLRLAVEAAGIQYWEWDRTGGTVSWGDGHARRWEEIRDQVHPEDRERYLAAVEKAWQQGEYACEYRMVARSGQHTWISARGKTMAEGRGRPHRMIGVAQDVTERRGQEEAVRFLADHDSLTGLPNRRLLDDRLRQAVLQAQRRGLRVAAMLIDLDDFKRVNDSAGHRAGDTVLREAALRLGACMRKADTLARHGGDEFVAVIPDAQTDADVRVVAEKILRSLDAPFHVEGAAFQLGASVGVSIFPGDASDAEALLRNADAAMYRAKQLGRNRSRFFSD